MWWASSKGERSAGPGEEFIEAPGVNAEVEGADGYGAGDEQREGDVGVDDCVEGVEEEAAGERVEAGAGFEGLFGEGEGAVDGEGFDDDSPDEGGDVEGGEPGAAARPDGAEDDPENPREVDGDDDGREDMEKKIHEGVG